MAIRAKLMGLVLVAVSMGAGLVPASIAAQEIPEYDAMTQVARSPESPPAGTETHIVRSLRRPSILRVPVPPLPSFSDVQLEVDHTVMAPQSGSRRGKAFMIAGGAALIGGLIIGGDAGTVIAVGGVALGVYGIILYF